MNDRERSWADVWSTRSISTRSGTGIADLLAADGYDTPFSQVEPSAWNDYVHRWALRLGIRPGTSIYEIGCGAGAFLAPLQQIGAEVGGCDLSPALINLARRALPRAELDLREASELPKEPCYDIVVANAVFGYFPSIKYARQVIELMVSKARLCVAIIDIPDSDLHNEELARRAALYGGDAAYESRYEGLQHLAFKKEWFADTMGSLGLHDLWFGHEELTGYVNRSTRFSVVAKKSSQMSIDPGVVTPD